MPSNPEKIVGNSGRCFKCNDPIYCREKEYNGNKSAQWQDKEGKAHYNKDGSCKGGSINEGTQAKSYTPATTKVVWEKVEDKSDDMTQLQLGLKGMIGLAYETVKESHPELDENSTTFGQIVNARTAHLIALAQIKATKESS